MFDPRERYLDDLDAACRDLDADVRQALRYEMSAHMDAAIEARVELGDPPARAMADAVAAMEPTQGLARRLRKVHLSPNPHLPALRFVLSMATPGLFMAASAGAWPGALLALATIVAAIYGTNRRIWALEGSLAGLGVMSGLVGAVTFGNEFDFGLWFSWIALSMWVLFASAHLKTTRSWMRQASTAPIVVVLVLVLFCPFWKGLFWQPSTLRDARDFWARLEVGKSGSITRYDAAHGGDKAPVLLGTRVEWQEGASWTKADQQVRPMLVRSAEEWRERLDSIDRAMEKPGPERAWPALCAGFWTALLSFLWMGLLHPLGAWMRRCFPVKPRKPQRRAHN